MTISRRDAQIKRNIRRNLAYLMQADNWTHAALGERAGCRGPTISRILAGLRGVSAVRLQRLSEALGVDVRVLLDSDLKK